jgi:hypothetical protein
MWWSPFPVIVLVVAIFAGSRIWRTHLMTQAARGRSREDDQLIGSMQSEIGRLTNRVKVLERLVTDDDRNLSREIERLRERPSPRP